MFFLTRCSPHVMTTPSRGRRYRTSRVPVNAGVAAQPGMEERGSESVFAIGRRPQNKANAPGAFWEKRELKRRPEFSHAKPMSVALATVAADVRHHKPLLTRRSFGCMANEAMMHEPTRHKSVSPRPAFVLLPFYRFNA